MVQQTKRLMLEHLARCLPEEREVGEEAVENQEVVAASEQGCSMAALSEAQEKDLPKYELRHKEGPLAAQAHCLAVGPCS